MNQHFLQSDLWEEYQKLEGHQTFRLKGTGYEALTILMSNGGVKYLFCPYGPTFKDLNSLRTAVAALKELGKRQGCLFIRIEPTNSGASVVAHQLSMIKSHDIDPAHSWAIDLSQTEEDITSQIEKRKIRHWRNYTKKGISIRTSQNPEEISLLTSLLNDLGERDKFTPQDENHLKNQLKAGFATLYFADFEDKTIAASLIYDHNGVRYYAHAAADNEYRKMVPGTILLIQKIIDAKKAKMKTFDFWGITTSTDPDHPWYGFTSYKKSFGGYQIDYAGTYDIPLNQLKYRLYSLARQVNRLKRKIIK